ncbi:hypothetical protein HPP92_016991 [Vanilla planifolia]|uniref:H(+)/Pi cotransporter n=1 Tax=Vanilla planifolia TaxID=51239 RepID=A0A835QFT5_VANPL|nr:hypothetical protein HPP92_016991 [Vanilla planifolia]
MDVRRPAKLYQRLHRCPSAVALHLAFPALPPSPPPATCARPLAASSSPPCGLPPRPQGNPFLTSFAMSIFCCPHRLLLNITVYAALRFACGFARSTVGTTCLRPLHRARLRRWRNTVSIFNFFCFTSGFLSFPPSLHLNRASSWGSVSLDVHPSIFCSILIYFFVQESPRWLLVKGRTEEAIKTLRKVSSSKEEVNFAELAEVATAEEQSNDAFSAARIIWGTPWAFRRLAVVMVVCFGIGMVYYGMPLNLGNLDGNLYLSVTLNALAELPSSLASFVIVRGMNRRSSTVVLTSSSGICSLVCAAHDRGWPEMAASGSVHRSMHGVRFDFVIRPGAVSDLREEHGYIGDAASGGVRRGGGPVAGGGGERKGFMTFVVFGLVILFTGLFACCLPETRSIGLTDTMEEEESRLKVARKQIHDLKYCPIPLERK